MLHLIPDAAYSRRKRRIRRCWRGTSRSQRARNGRKKQGKNRPPQKGTPGIFPDADLGANLRRFGNGRLRIFLCEHPGIDGINQTLAATTLKTIEAGNAAGSIDDPVFRVDALAFAIFLANPAGNAVRIQSDLEQGVFRENSQERSDGTNRIAISPTEEKRKQCNHQQGES